MATTDGRIKNALTRYHVAELSETPEYLQLGQHITEVTDNTADTTNEQGFYDGDGNLRIDVTGVAESYGFTGMFNPENPAMMFISNLRRKIGDERIISFKITNPDGSTEEGPAVVSDIIYRGGAATDFPVFSCNIRFEGEPEVTPAGA